jgi:quinol monooxygenase YgiN
MIRVLIERRVVEDRISDYQLAVRVVRLRAMDCEGYTSGETLRDVDDPNRFVIISTWDDVAAWKAWAASGDRREIVTKLGPMLLQSERITVLEPV